MTGHRRHKHTHSHTHGLVDESITRSKAGIRAVSLSFLILLLGALVQLILFGVTHSVALLADIIHNAGDAMTAIPLGLAFYLQSKKGEKWAGYCVVLVILASAFVVLYQVIEKFIHPTAPNNPWVIVAAGAVGVATNEAAAIIRWRAGKKLDSPALIADGNHARADGYVSAGVIAGAIFIALGFPVADPIVGLIIVVLIVQSSWQSWQTIRVQDSHEH